MAGAISSGDILSEALVSVLQKGISLRNALPEMDEIEVNTMLAEKVRQGYQPGWNELSQVINDQERFIKMISGDKLLAIVKKDDGEGDHEKVKFERVFS